MKTDVEKAKEVDEYILKASGLVKDKKGYNALLQLLHTGVLLYDRLGQNTTFDLCKILNYLKFDYDFLSNGIKLKDNSKLNFYRDVMYPSKEERVYVQNYHNSIGKNDPEESEIGWAERKLSQK